MSFCSEIYGTLFDEFVFVFRGWLLDIGKLRGEVVAIKKAHSSVISNHKSIEEFRREVAVLCALSHPNILRFCGACTRPPHLIIITEFCGRGTLFDYLHKENHRLSWELFIKMAVDLCQGMMFLHSSNLLHRDLKSSNLMLSDNFNIKVRCSMGTFSPSTTLLCSRNTRFIRLCCCDSGRRLWSNESSAIVGTDDGPVRHVSVHGTGSVGKYAVLRQSRCLLIRDYSVGDGCQGASILWNGTHAGE